MYVWFIGSLADWKNHVESLCARYNIKLNQSFEFLVDSRKKWHGTHYTHEIAVYFSYSKTITNHQKVTEIKNRAI